MRLFLAVELDDIVRARMAACGEALRGRLRPALARAAAWVPPANLHLTLRFLGWQNDEQVERLEQALATPFASAPFDLELRDLGHFPPRGSPRVLWVGVGQGRDTVVALHAEIELRLRELGFLPEDRPFHPHVTLARFKSERLPRGARLPEPLGEAALGVCHVAAITLFESRLSPKGPTYLPRLRCPLS
jgi:RNA 2',3'-cyclic 3'-phosphodiesterase